MIYDYFPCMVFLCYAGFQKCWALEFLLPILFYELLNIFTPIFTQWFLLLFQVKTNFSHNWLKKCSPFMLLSLISRVGILTFCLILPHLKVFYRHHVFTAALVIVIYKSCMFNYNCRFCISVHFNLTYLFKWSQNASLPLQPVLNSFDLFIVRSH